MLKPEVATAITITAIITGTGITTVITAITIITGIITITTADITVTAATGSNRTLEAGPLC